MTVAPLGDSAVVLAIDDAIGADVVTRVRAIAAELERRPLSGVVDVVPAFGRIAVFFDPAPSVPFEELKNELQAIVARADAVTVATDLRTVEIPVCYGGGHGPDLEHVATKTHRSVSEVIALHSGSEYTVQAIGFSPGFPYLGGLPAELATPRRATPRSRVPPGSVGIGGTQTGIYPLETPGGWNLIGRTPLQLFNAMRREPSLLRAGDRVRFRAIAEPEFERIAREEAASAPAARAGGESAAVASASVPGIEVTRAGMFTTVQDLGRRGHRARGVPLSGATDRFALRVANMLVGNREDAAALEFTLVGPELKFLHETVIAVCGAEFEACPGWRPIVVRAGTIVTLRTLKRGCRGYLAVAGGVAVERVLGSRSTYVRARLGGFQGRALHDGDVLPVPNVQRTFRNHWHIDERILPRYAAAAIVRVLPGAHAAEFHAAWTESVFTISAQSDRMGVRLKGPALPRQAAGDLLSLPIVPGTVQVPPDGLPIVLLADAQTIGGYPQLAHVIAVDLPIVAQLRPGDSVRFVLVTIEIARELMTAQERALGLLCEGVTQKLA